MQTPNPSFLTNGPLQVLEAKTLFPSNKVVVNKAATLNRLSTGRLMLAFGHSEGAVNGNFGSVVFSKSDDNGKTWSAPKVVHENPSWHCMIQGGMMRFRDDFVRLFVGGIQIDFGLGGHQPFDKMYVVPVDTRDGGETWSKPGPEVSLFPVWTEMYGSSNPHKLSDGRYMLACMGTLGRDTDWHSGVTFTDSNGNGYTKPTIIAQAPGRDYSDIDCVRLNDGRFLAVVREHQVKDSVYSHSSDEGKTWTPIKPTGFKGANPRLLKLRNGSIACAYRNEDRATRAINISVSEDGGHKWKLAGTLNVGDDSIPIKPSYISGYPSMVYINDRDIACVFHTYPEKSGRVELHMVTLRDMT